MAVAQEDEIVGEEEDLEVEDDDEETVSVPEPQEETDEPDTGEVRKKLYFSAFSMCPFNCVLFLVGRWCHG